MKRTRSTIIRFYIYCLLLACGTYHATLNSLQDHSNAVYRADINTTINPGAAGILDNAIQVAQQNKARALILRINTPGGLLSSTRDMVSLIEKSSVPIIGYVAPAGASAGSAGAFILLSTHIAIMNKGTNVGASSPISGDGEDIKGTLGTKVMNDSKAFMRSIAQSRGRNSDAAELFVSKAVSLTAEEALDQKVIDAIVSNETELFEKLSKQEFIFNDKPHSINIDNDKLTVIDVAPRFMDQLLVHIAHPQIAHLLISLGTLGIYIEIISPGLAFPGIFGAIAVVLGLVGIQTLPVSFGFLLLLFLGITLMLSEYFITGFGILGIGGAIAFIVGSLYLFETPIPIDYQDGILSMSIAISAAMVLITLLITYGLFGKPRRKKMLGKTGEAMMDFATEGFILIEGQRWPAETQEPLSHGDAIIVIEESKSKKLLIKKA